MQIRAWLLILPSAVALLGVPGRAQVYNLRLVTDNVPDFTDLPSFVESATGAWETPEEKCIAIWRWARRSRRQTSCAVEHGRHIWDPILHYNSYGAMNCGIVSSLNISAWLQLGYRARYLQLGDHTVSEVSWDDGQTWHLFDSSMSILCYNHDGQVASSQEIQEAAACERSQDRAEPGHYYLYHPAPQCASHLGPTGWRCAADEPVAYQRTLAAGAESYTDGFSVDRYCQQARFGHRFTLNLRPYEFYTRYWEPLDDAQAKGDTSANDPDYFRPLANGTDPDDQHGLNNIRGNGLWVFQPNLAEETGRNLFSDVSGIEGSTGLPHLHPARTGQTAWVAFPISAAHVITSLRLEAEGRRQTEGDLLRILVSRQAGIHWQPVWQADKTGAQSIRLNLRDEVAGVSQCWIKIEMRAGTDRTDTGLDALKVTTVTQLNRRTLPALTLGGNPVRLRADSQAETVELWPALHDGHYTETVLEETNVFSDAQPDGIYKATLGAGVDNQPCSVTWRLAVPRDILELQYGVVSTVRSPRSYVALQHSWDGIEFQELYRQEGDGFPFDKQLQLERTGSDVPPGVRQIFFRGVFFCKSGAATYNMPGIQDLLIRVQHQPRPVAVQPIEITYNWTEHRDTGPVTRAHTERVTRLPHTYRINVAGRRDPTMNWVRLNLQKTQPEGASPHLGYSDGVDVGSGCEHPKVTYCWGNLLSGGIIYTASRPSSPDAGNPDTGGTELTDGIVIAPTDQTTSGPVQPATAFWDPGEAVRFVVDLAATKTIGGVRITTHQPNTRFCHPQRIEVAVSADGQAWQPAGIVRHDDLWKPPGDYEPWEHDDDPSYAHLPAGGRLVYSYPLAFRQPLAGRYVRFLSTPQEGKGMGLSELQVFDRVEVIPWPDEIQHTHVFPTSP